MIVMLYRCGFLFTVLMFTSHGAALSPGGGAGEHEDLYAFSEAGVPVRVVDTVPSHGAAAGGAESSAAAVIPVDAFTPEELHAQVEIMNAEMTQEDRAYIEKLNSFLKEQIAILEKRLNNLKKLKANLEESFNLRLDSSRILQAKYEESIDKILSSETLEAMDKHALIGNLNQNRAAEEAILSKQGQKLSFDLVAVEHMMHTSRQQLEMTQRSYGQLRSSEGHVVIDNHGSMRSGLQMFDNGWGAGVN